MTVAEIVFRRRGCTCNLQYHKIIGTAWLGIKCDITGSVSVSTVMTFSFSMAMMGIGTMMVRMDILAGYTADESRHERTLSTHAGVDTESYDSHKIPNRQHDCAYFHEHISHHKSQMYKKHSKLKEICSTFVINASNIVIRIKYKRTKINSS